MLDQLHPDGTYGNRRFEVLSRATKFPQKIHPHARVQECRSKFIVLVVYLTWIHMSRCHLDIDICNRYDITLANVYLKPLQPIRLRLPRLLCAK